MAGLRAASLAALFVTLCAGPLAAQDVFLRSHDGAVGIEGDLLGFDGEFYRVDTIYGELTVDGSGVTCEGPGCPDLEAFVARAVFSGAPIIGRVLLPSLLEAFAIRDGYVLRRHDSTGDDLRLTLHARGDGETLLADFRFRLTTSDEGLADLVAGEADIAMSLREARPEELARAREAGLGDLTKPARMRVLALDALVPVVAPANPVQSLSLRDLSRTLKGEIANWSALGGPDAPIDLHLWASETGIGQATADQAMLPDGRDLREAVTPHRDGAALARAVADNPFAFGLTPRSEQGEAWELPLTGPCGFALRADRRTVKTEDYPLTAPLLLYLPARRFPRLIRDFISYIDDPSAQLVIRRAGFVDQAPEEIGIARQGDRFANAIAMAGDETSLDELKRMVGLLAPLRRLTTSFRFEAGSARLDVQSRSNVERLADALQLGLFDNRRLVFVGFSDSKGPATANRDIARRRAQAVRDAVVAMAKTARLDRVDIAVDAFGEAMPMACDDTAWGRRVNRRVEVWVR
ncbi:substrate-binding domain-containing protein [Roseovarius ramblicola]|uniref:Substrate-binding domain-containing protein n=1 Tax=Roseovarius ramblicola TaxID=2022336 RepID=A0ABV5HXB2_9RHOB